MEEMKNLVVHQATDMGKFSTIRFNRGTGWLRFGPVMATQSSDVDVL